MICPLRIGFVFPDGRVVIASYRCSQTGALWHKVKGGKWKKRIPR
jgi:hypothetical protein